MVWLGAICVGLAWLVTTGSAGASRSSLLDHEGVSLHTPANGSTYTTTDTLSFSWTTTWYHAQPSTLHFFIGTGGSADNVVHQHYTCPGSTAPSCITSLGFRNFAPGTYTWGVDHEFPGYFTKHSDRWTFTVKPVFQPPPSPPPLPPPPRAPPLPRVPPRPATNGPGGVAVLGGTLSYRGSVRANVVDVVKVGRSFVLTQEGRLQVGRGCRRLDRRSAACPSRGIRTFFADMGGGDDSIAASIALPSTLLGGQGSDRLEGGAGGDRLNGGSGDDTVDGSFGSDRLEGEGSDVLLGGEGDDALFARTSLDGTANGGAGNDYVQGDAADNVLTGGEGNDHLDGSDGSDKLLGGAGIDVLIGGAGGDALSGNRPDELAAGVSDGNDLVYCGPGFDSSDYGDPTTRVDGTTCESISWVGGVGGGHSALVKRRLHRVQGARPYVEIYVETRAKLDRFKVKLTFRNASGRVVADPPAVEDVPGRQWVTLRQLRLPNSVRRVQAVVVT